MGIFEKYKLKGAKPSQGYQYFNAGYTYLCESVNCKKVSARKGGEFYSHTFRILESDDPKLGTGKEANVFWEFGEDWTPGNILALTVALSGEDPYDPAVIAEDGETDWDAIAELSIDEKEQALKGNKVRVVTKDRIKKDKDGKDPKDHYALHEFYPVTE